MRAYTNIQSTYSYRFRHSAMVKIFPRFKISMCIRNIATVTTSLVVSLRPHGTTRVFGRILTKFNSGKFLKTLWRKYSYSTTNKWHLLSQIIYSCKTLYMFPTFLSSIIRSSKLRIQ
jgi:hypothetical protein